jgi:hypothetical protein
MNETLWLVIIRQYVDVSSQQLHSVVECEGNLFGVQVKEILMQ